VNCVGGSQQMRLLKIHRAESVVVTLAAALARLPYILLGAL